MEGCPCFQDGSEGCGGALWRLAPPQTSPQTRSSPVKLPMHLNPDSLWHPWELPGHEGDLRPLSSKPLCPPWYSHGLSQCSICDPTKD